MEPSQQQYILSLNDPSSLDLRIYPSSKSALGSFSYAITIATTTIAEHWDGEYCTTMDDWWSAGVGSYSVNVSTADVQLDNGQRQIEWIVQLNPVDRSVAASAD